MLPRDQLDVQKTDVAAEVVLVFPPPWVPFQPYASVPALAGALEKANISHRCIDASLEFFEEYLTSEALGRCYDRRRRGGRDVPTALVHTPAVLDLYAEDVMDRVGQVPAILRGEAFYDTASRSLALNLLSRSLDIVASGFPGCSLGLDRACGPWNHRSSRSLLQAALDPPANPFLELYERRLLPRILEPAPKVLGISVVFADQAFPALLLARRVRERSPETRVVLGGPFLTANREAFQVPDHPFLAEIADFIVFGEGESVFVELVEGILEGRIDPRPMPGSDRLLMGRQEDLDTLPRPAYEALPLNRYLSPEPVLTVLTSRGCYWNRCEFCDIPGIGERGFYRAARPETVLASLDGLAEQTGARCFAFWDDAVPPRTLRGLAGLLSDRGRAYSWYAQTRADDVLDAETCQSMYESGCRQLYVGIETGSPRLAKVMRKGLDLERVRKVAQRLSDAGIVVSAGFFFGFPGEDEADVEATLRFMLADVDSIYPSSASVGAFSLRKDSPIHLRAAEEGVRVTEPDSHDLALDLAFELREPAPFDRFELAARIRRFLDDQGFDQDRFGPHYLLFQVRTGDSTPELSPRAEFRRTAAYGLSQGLRWQRGDDGHDDAVTVYVPATASLVRMAGESAGWLWSEGRDELDRVVGLFGRETPAKIRRLLGAGLLVPRLSPSARFGADVTSCPPDISTDIRSLP